MNMRPRCRAWLPLATQQLRLRNLVRIQGLNIECLGDDISDKTLIYYTLHHTKDGGAIYTSEALPQRHLQQKWAELACPMLLKSNSNCVCVKVWAQLGETEQLRVTTTSSKVDRDRTENTPQMEKEARFKAPLSALSEDLSKNTGCRSSKTLTRSRDVAAASSDRLLFTLAVYFSGLILLGQPPQTDTMCRTNSLIFQLNGDYFAAPEHLTPQSLRAQLALNYQLHAPSVPTPSDEFAINSPPVSRSSSPVEPLLDDDLVRMSKMRYLQLNCARTDVRRSYDLQRLLQVQLLQRLHLQKLREIVEISAEIRQRCVRCITQAEQQQHSRRKPRTTSASSAASLHHHHSMGRALTVLLAEEQEIDPAALLRTQQLQRQLETLRSKQRLLQTERDTYAERNAQRRRQLNELLDSRATAKAHLHTRLAQLREEQSQLAVTAQLQLVLFQSKRHVTQQLEHRMSTLCMELREIYPIGQLTAVAAPAAAAGLYTVCGIALPNMEEYVNDAKYAHSIGLEIVSPMALSAALGYVAHLVQMIAVVINRPLRNPILHEGSRTRIMDIIKEIPYASREFPLYTRSSIPSKPVKYAIFLLNQNIAQLCYDITGTRCDLRATIENLLRIFAALGRIEQNKSGDEIHTTTTRTHPKNRLALQHNNSKSESGIATLGNGTTMTMTTVSNSAECLSKSHSSIDMNHVPVHVPTTTMASTTNIMSSSLLPSSQPLPIASSRSATQPRICRSVGSYSDCEDEDPKYIIDQRYSNSDINITFQSGHV